MSSAFRQLAGALALAREFLLLEDDYDVDWEAEYREEFGYPFGSSTPGLDSRAVTAEVDEWLLATGTAEAPLGAASSWAAREAQGSASVAAPPARRESAGSHRRRRHGNGTAAGRRRVAPRRSGQGPTAPQVCLSPIRRSPARFAQRNSAEHRRIHARPAE